MQPKTDCSRFPNYPRKPYFDPRSRVSIPDAFAAVSQSSDARRTSNSLHSQRLFGCNLPTEDIFMSPDQLLLVLDEPGAVQFREHLVWAEDLIQDRAGVRYEPNTMSAFAIVFEDHEIILANGIWTSSSIRQFDADGSLLTAQQKELLAVSDPKPMRISRPVMTAKRAKQLFSRTNRTLGIYRSN